MTNSWFIDKVSKIDIWIKILLMIVVITILGRMITHYFEAKYNSIVMAQHEVVTRVADNLHMELNSSLTALKIVAMEPEFYFSQTDKLNQRMQQIMKELGFLSTYVDQQGNIVIAASNSLLEDSPAIIIEHNQDSWVPVSNRVDSGELNRAYIKLSVPVSAPDGSKIGMLIASIPISNISKVVERQTLSHDQYIFVMDGQKNIISHPLLARIYKDEADYSNTIIEFFHQKEGAFVDTSGLDQANKLFVYTSIDNIDWRVVHAMPIQSVYLQVFRDASADIEVIVLLVVCIVLLVIVLNQSRRYMKTMESFHMERLAAVNQIAAGLTHEIRNPLTSIKGFIQLILYRDKGKPAKEYLELILSEVERIDKLIEEFRNLSRPVTAPELKKIDLKASMDSVLLLMRSQLELKQIQMAFEVKHNCTAIADGEQLRQVWMNLLRNAIDAVDEKGIITVEIDCKVNMALVAVSDNGPGIPEDLLDKIGTPFLTTKQTGTGLGLFMCYNIAAQHGGNVEVVSKTGRGTTFVVRLPCAD